MAERAVATFVAVAIVVVLSVIARHMIGLGS